MKRFTGKGMHKAVYEYGYVYGRGVEAHGVPDHS